MERRIEPEAAWWLAPWNRKTTSEKVAIILGIVFSAWQTVELYETGHPLAWFWISGYWLVLGWAYFSRSQSREVIVITELKLNDSRSVQAERHLLT
ncbi:MAG: hypothetical protein F4X77_02635 [Acidobacteriia bacterium]|nr:hypothetical protein [Terriglobia bacterium]